MILVVEDKYGIIQVNDSDKDITIKDLYKALGFVMSKNFKCDLAVWNNSDMSQKLFSTASYRATLKEELHLIDFYHLLEFLSMPEIFNYNGIKNENDEY